MRLKQKMAAWLTAVLLVVVSVAQAVSLDDVQVISAPLIDGLQAANGTVRVLLSSLSNPQTLTLTVNGHYNLSTGESLASGTMLTLRFNQASGDISLSWGGQTRNMGSAFSLRRQSSASENNVLISESRNSQNPYPADFAFEAVSSGGGYALYTIAQVDIETYLYGVVPYEMDNSASPEALKAQAVAARTYAMRMMQQRASGRYDVKDTTSDQFYSGTPSGYANCKAAVDATKGIALMYGADYCTTFYSASNGGQMETSRGGTNYAYLKVKDDPFDYSNPSSAIKSKTISANLAGGTNPDGLTSLLQQKLIENLNQQGYAANASNTTLQTLQSITPHTPKYASPSRLYTKMDFMLSAVTQKAPGQDVLVTQTVTCSIFDELESLLSMSLQSSANELWSVETTSGGFLLQARRYGHGMGMSQRGAMYMGKLGYTYDQILGFYFEGARLVWHSFAATKPEGGSAALETTLPVTTTAPVQVLPEYDNEGIGFATVTAADYVNLRESGSMNGRVVGTAPTGATLKVLSQNGSWAKVMYQGLTAYANTGFIAFEGEQSPKQELSPISTQSQEENVSIATVNTSNGTLNMRTEATIAGRILTTIPRGTQIRVLQRGQVWSGVSYAGMRGYVMTEFLSFGTVPAHQDEETIAAKQTATVVTPSGALNLREFPSLEARVLTSIPRGYRLEMTRYEPEWSRVRYQGMEGFVKTQYLSTDQQTEFNPLPDIAPVSYEDTAAPRMASVNTVSGGVNLRENAGIAYPVITTIPRGEQVTVLHYGSSWCFVRYRGMEGHVMSRFLRFGAVMPFSVPEAEISDADTGMPDETYAVSAWIRTSSGSLNLRQQPNLDAFILTSIPQNAKVKLLEEGNEWSYIAYHQQYGYVMSRYLTVDRPNEWYE